MCIIAYCTIEKNCGKLFWAFTKYCHENLNYHVQWYACYLIAHTRYPDAGDCDSTHEPQRPL